MAYHNTSGTAANTEELMTKLNAFLTGTVGWTLHDDGSADPSPFWVVKSTGESGNEDIYLHFFDDTGTNRVALRAYHYWNATTHSGIKPAYNASYTYLKSSDSTSFLYWFFADLDHWFVVTKIGSTYWGQYAGIIQRFWSSEVAFTQASLSAGASVVVPVDNAAIFQVGKPYIIRDDANIERVVITATDTTSAPNTITLETVLHNYAAGSKLGEDPSPVFLGKYESPDLIYGTNDWDGYGSATNQSGNCVAADGGAATSAASDARYGLTTMFPWLVTHSGNNNELRGQLIEVYAVGSTNLDSEDIIQQGENTFRVFDLSRAGFCAVRE